MAHFPVRPLSPVLSPPETESILYVVTMNWIKDWSKAAQVFKGEFYFENRERKRYCLQSPAGSLCTEHWEEQHRPDPVVQFSNKPWPIFPFLDPSCFTSVANRRLNSPQWADAGGFLCWDCKHGMSLLLLSLTKGQSRLLVVFFSAVLLV